jgi:amino acid adenylation domain-containing protein
LGELVRRQPVFRTVYETGADGIPVQTVRPPQPVPFVIADLRGLPEAQFEAQLRRLVSEAERHVFDPGGDELLRATLVRRRDQEHLLILTVHHIAWDYASEEIALRDLSEIYGDLSPGQAPCLTDLRASLRASAACGDDADYWKERLAGSPRVLPLALDRPRGPQQSFQAGRESLSLGHKLSARLRSQKEFSAFESLLGGFLMLLHRHTGSEDIVVGCPVFQRTLEATGVSGGHTNLIALRTDFSGTPTYRELLIQVRDGMVEAQAHKNLTFEELMRYVDWPVNSMEAPFVQAMFAMRETGQPAAGSSAWKLELPVAEAGFDLFMEVEAAAEGFHCSLKYNAELFDRETIRRMLGHYQTLLEAVTEKMEVPAAQIPMLTPAELRRQLVEWNETGSKFPEATVSRLFEAHARRSPERVAVICDQRRLTYGELNARANRLAHALRRLGVGPDTMVAICVDRSLEMVVGLLAILKAGGAYVPLDPVHPKSRLAGILEDLGKPVLLCQRALTDALTRYARTVLPVEDWPALTAGESGENPEPAGDLDHIAYVLHTSGSTGRPKGVLIPQRALVNLLWSACEWFGFAANDVLMAVTTIAFDIAAVDMWLPLITGARMVVAMREVAADGKRLIAALSAEGATFLQGTPATWRLLLDAGWEGKENLRAVCTGEAMPCDLAEQLRLRTARLWNMYGPTETTVWSTGYEIKSPGPVYIGRPMANTSAFILNAALQPAPIGVIGELYLGGAGLARGYLNQPVLTGEKFVANPFDGACGGRLYKTGDLARYLSDGNIECLGRDDNQVKIRGFRIELGEIEAALVEHEDVREAVVTVWDTPTDRRLIGYIVAGKRGEPEEDEVRGFLKQRLPEYMLPARYIFLSRFPLTPSGKVDRRALPTPEQSGKRAAGPNRSDLDVLEARLSGMWEELLQLPRIGLEEDFFDLGGHSLLAAQLLARIDRELHQRLPLTALFQAPTVKRLAALLRDGTAHNPKVSSIQPQGSRPPFFCVGAGPLFRALAKRLDADQPFFGLNFGADDRLSAPYRLEDVAAACIQTLREVQKEGPYFLGGWSDAGVIAYEMAQQLEQQGQKVALVVLFDADNPAYRPGFSTLEALRARAGFVVEWLRFKRALFLASGSRAVLEDLRLSLAYRRRLWRERTVNTSLSVKRWAGLHVDTLQVMADVAALAVRGYQPRAYGGRVVLFQCTDRPKGRFRDRLLGWGNLIGRLETFETPGDHMGMFRDPHVRVLGERLNACLLEAANSPK